MYYNYEVGGNFGQMRSVFFLILIIVYHRLRLVWSSLSHVKTLPPLQLYSRVLSYPLLQFIYLFFLSFIFFTLLIVAQTLHSIPKSLTTLVGSFIIIIIYIYSETENGFPLKSNKYFDYFLFFSFPPNYHSSRIRTLLRLKQF